MRKISLCVGSQTPPVRFKLDSDALFERYGDLPRPVPISALIEGEDFDYTPGGVTEMIAPLLQRAYREGRIRSPHWVTINPLGPAMASMRGVVLHRIEMAPAEFAGYGRFKETMWRNIHGLEQTWIPHRYFADFALLNWLYAKKIMDLDSEIDFDLSYIHDFQLLLVGSMLGPTVCNVFQWHIPLDMTIIQPRWRAFLLRYLEDYDAVIVSCKRYKRSLVKAGFRGRVYQIYPYINERAHKAAASPMVAQFCERFGIHSEDQVMLVVARLDPIKGQNTAIRALAHIHRRFPNAKLVLVGDGSFSSARRGGLGLPKGARWLDRLVRLANRLGVRDKVIFTRYLSKEELKAAYTRADVVVVPSVLDGFNLTVLEGWAYKKPVIVSSGAGAAELVVDGENGYTFHPNDYRGLANKMTDLFLNPERAQKTGERGLETAREHCLEKGIQSILNVFSEALGK